MKFRKIQGIILLVICSNLFVAQQPVIEIHQIDVGTPGDATLIKVTTPQAPNSTVTITRSVLIDGGEPKAAITIINYLKSKYGGNLGNSPCLSYVISSHYHNDHIGGLVGNLAPRKKKPKTGADGNTDDCPKRTGVITSAQVDIFAILDKGKNPPIPTSRIFNKYDKSVSISGKRIDIGHFTPPNGSSQTIVPGDCGSNVPAGQVLRLGDCISLGVVNGVPVLLRLWVVNGYLWTPKQSPYYLDLGAQVRINPNSEKYKNANNWGSAWVLEYGTFHYFTGGDVGGDDKDAYFDIETPLANQFKEFYPINGHICSLKISHHGSEHSTYLGFLKTLQPGAAVISCGNDGGHNFPRQEMIKRLEDKNWWPPSGVDNKRYFITEWNFLEEPRSKPNEKTPPPGQITKHLDTLIGKISGSFGYFISPNKNDGCECEANKGGGFFCRIYPIATDLEGKPGDIKTCVYPAAASATCTFEVYTRHPKQYMEWNPAQIIQCHPIN